MKFEFDDDKPIYKQLVEQLKVKIITGEYQLGEKLPSVRELSILIMVNPNTIQRALTELEEEKLIITKRTAGKFVTDQEKVIVEARKDLASKMVHKFLEDMLNLKLSKDEIVHYIQNNKEDL